ncbi:hypothetical protein [Psychromarinibacter sediminicola]|nr:hypothetical protein [Psychromarinibacter sediminicola]
MQQIDAYCERTDAALWSEPLNALTNAAFLLAALVMAWRLRGRPLPLAWVMVVVLALVGLASGAWHMWAVAWTGAADSGSIAVFILIYLYAANRHFLDLRPLPALSLTALILPALAAAGWVAGRLPFFEVSAVYWPVALLIAAYAAGLWRRAPATARRLALGAALLAVSITARSLDAPLCDTVPIGTHFLWHLLNALMLGWMIETYARHRAGQHTRAT